MIADVLRAHGRTIVRLDRIHYSFKGELDTVNGPLEVELDDGVVLLLDSAPDGETVRVELGRWEDAFAEPLSAENREFVATSGKWTRVPVSDQAPYSELIGARVLAVGGLLDVHGAMAGCAFETERQTLWFIVTFDETEVRWAHPLGYTRAPISGS